MPAILDNEASIYFVIQGEPEQSANTANQDSKDEVNVEDIKFISNDNAEVRAVVCHGCASRTTY